MTEIQKKLFELSDSGYAAFQARLAPNIAAEKCMGVRVPALRSFASEFSRTPECAAFLETLPHEYYDENLLHSVLLEKWKDYDDCLNKVECFLPFVDNWAVCDTLRPKVFGKHKAELIEKLKEWIASEQTYTCRFGVDMLMTHYLDDSFKPEYLKLPAQVTSEEYYVRMMIAWYYATALAKQWDSTVLYLEQNRLPKWTHNKTIQKAVESYRITPEQKTYLKTLRR